MLKSIVWTSRNKEEKGMVIENLKREQFNLLMQPVIKFKRKHDLEYMGPLLLAIEEDESLCAELSRPNGATTIPEECEEKLLSRYREVADEIMPIVDKIFDRCIGERRLKRDFCVILLGPTFVRAALKADHGAVQEAYDASKGKQLPQCLAAFEDALGLSRGFLTPAIQAAFESDY